MSHYRYRRRSGHGNAQRLQRPKHRPPLQPRQARVSRVLDIRVEVSQPDLVQVSVLWEVVQVARLQSFQSQLRPHATPRPPHSQSTLRTRGHRARHQPFQLLLQTFLPPTLTLSKSPSSEGRTLKRVPFASWTRHRLRPPSHSTRTRLSLSNRPRTWRHQTRHRHHLRTDDTLLRSSRSPADESVRPLRR